MAPNKKSNWNNADRCCATILTIDSSILVLLQRRGWDRLDRVGHSLVFFIGIQIVCDYPYDGSPTAAGCIPLRPPLWRFCPVDHLLDDVYLRLSEAEEISAYDYCVGCFYFALFCGYAFFLSPILGIHFILFYSVSLLCVLFQLSFISQTVLFMFLHLTRLSSTETHSNREGNTFRTSKHLVCFWLISTYFNNEKFKRFFRTPVKIPKDSR